MGHTVNPVSNRLRINFFWKSIWCTYTNFNYKYLLLGDLKFYQFILLLMKSPFFKKSFIVLADWSLLYHNTRCILFINYFPLTYRFFNIVKRRLKRKFYRIDKKRKKRYFYMKSIKLKRKYFDLFRRLFIVVD